MVKQRGIIALYYDLYYRMNKRQMFVRRIRGQCRPHFVKDILQDITDLGMGIVEVRAIQFEAEHSRGDSGAGTAHGNGSLRGKC